MDFLNTAFAQLGDLFKSMTAGAKLTAGLLLVAIVASLGYLFNHQIAGPDAFLLGGQSFSQSELNAMAAALAKAGLNGHEVEAGGRIRIPRAQQAAYVAAIAEGDALPLNWGDGLRKAVEGDSPFSTSAERAERIRAAKQQNLSLILQSMKDVAKASITYDEKKKSGFGQPAVATASVGVQLIGGRALDDDRVRMIRHFVASAFAGLDPQQVTVADLTSGRVHVGDSNGGIGVGGDHQYIAAMKSFEQEYRHRILGALTYVPGVAVELNVELDKELRSSSEKSVVDPKAVAVRTVESTNALKSEAAARGGPPGLSIQQPQANAGGRIADAGKGSSTDEERTSTETENAVGKETTRTENIGLTPKRVTVSVVVPSNYYEKVWRERNPAPEGQAPKPPDDKAIAQIESLEKDNIRKTVAALIPNPTNLLDLTPLVNVTTMTSIAAPAVTGPSTSEQALSWLGENWTTVGMIGLALFSLLMVRSMIRSSPAAVRGFELPSLKLAEEDADQPGAAAGQPAASSKAEPARSRLRRKQSSGTLKEDLSELVKEDPDAAANILRSWIGSASERMQPSAGNIRKAAILVACLDRRAADALLDQMPPAQADLVRRAAMEIDAVDDAEQESVLQEFLGRDAPAESEDAGVELAGALAGRRFEELERGAKSPAPAGEPFLFLQQAQADELSPVLGDEHPQTIAMVVSHMPPERAARLLGGLTSHAQAEVLRRLVDLEESHPAIVREVERGLESRIAQRSQTVRARAGGLSVVAKMLGAAERPLERRLLESLRRHAPELAGQLGRYEFEFEDLSQLADSALRRLIAAAEPQTLLLALAGASLRIVERMQSQLPAAHSRALEQAWRRLPPTSLADLEAAQGELVALAEELDRSGRIELPRHFRVAPLESGGRA